MADGSGNPAIEIDDLRFSYGENGFELTVPQFRLTQGETAVCIGSSGCGKTTFLNLIAGILLAEHGRVVTHGHEWSKLSDAERRRLRISHIGLVFQAFELLDYLNVRENILVPYFVNRALTLDDEVEAELESLARATGVLDLLRRRPRDLSHGERQRVAICRALVTHPRLLLADEPTGNLDPDTTRRVLDILLQEVRKRHTSLVMVTHDHSLLDDFDSLVDFADFLGARGERAGR